MVRGGGSDTTEAAPNRYVAWWRRAMWLGIVQDWVLGIPAIFAPEKTLKATKQRPTGDPVWTSFAALLVVLLSFSYIPGAQDPFRYRKSAWLSVLARPPGVLFFFVLRPRVYPLFGLIDAVLTAIQGPLLVLALRQRRNPAAPVPADPAADGPGAYADGDGGTVATSTSGDGAGASDGAREYSGSTFNEVKAVAFSGPYERLPHHRGLRIGRFVRFFNDGARNLIDRRDILPRFDKLIHANGICFTGVWRIDRGSPYTGYFARGSEGLLIARASVAGNELNAGQRRSFGIAGKVYPTMDPEEKVKPGNFVTVTDLSGRRTRHITDYAPTNNPRVGLDPGANLVNRGIFRLLDTRPGLRQLHPISTLGVPPGAPVVTPDLMRLRVADGTPEVDAKDFRDELRLKHRPGHRLVYTIEVKSFEEDEWTRIGSIELTDDAVAEGGDKRLHFWIPRDIPSRA